LKTEVALSGETTITEAVSVEENPVIPAGTFAVPEGIVWTEM